MAQPSVLRYALIWCFFLTALSASAEVVATPPYKVSVFATSIPGVDFAPDSIAVVDGLVFIGYGDNATPTGAGTSTIVEYTLQGEMVHTYTVSGHNDGIKVNPNTHLVWAMQNEDGNPNLVIIDPKTQSQTEYTFGLTPHGGGYDDMVFRGNDVFLSASNPTHNPNTKPAIVKAEIVGKTVSVTPVLLGDANVIDIPTNNRVKLNLQDPDSMILDPFGDIVLDSQADGELIIVHDPGAADQSAYHLGLRLKNGDPVQIDDTIFATASYGVILAADRDGETVYAITRNIFAPSTAYSAAPHALTETNLNTGVLTPVVTGFVSLHGMAFIPAP